MTIFQCQLKTAELLALRKTNPHTLDRHKPVAEFVKIPNRHTFRTAKNPERRL